MVVVGGRQIPELRAQGAHAFRLVFSPFRDLARYGSVELSPFPFPFPCFCFCFLPIVHASCGRALLARDPRAARPRLDGLVPLPRSPSDSALRR